MVPGVAWGAEFSAQMMVKDDVKTMPGKIYVSDGKMRQEFADERGQTITIVRPDLKVVWVILPRQRTYLEIPLHEKAARPVHPDSPQAVGKRLLGQERVNGYDADKYEVSVPVGRGLEKQTYWVAAKLGLPIKMECRERHFSLEYRSIKEEKVPDRLFNLPPGLAKADLHRRLCRQSGGMRRGPHSREAGRGLASQPPVPAPVVFFRDRIYNNNLIAYGSARFTGGAPGLQIRCAVC